MIEDRIIFYRISQLKIILGYSVWERIMYGILDIYNNHYIFQISSKLLLKYMCDALPLEIKWYQTPFIEADWGIYASVD